MMEHKHQFVSLDLLIDHIIVDILPWLLINQL